MSLSFSHAHSQGSGTTEVVAVLIAITDNCARVLTVDGGKLLPNGPLTPLHRSLQAGVRQWVEEQTGQPLGYIEQLYTFVDTNRRNRDGHALVYVSYMGLVQEVEIVENSNQDHKSNKQKEEGLSSVLGRDSDNDARWQDWYDYFPWENRIEPKSRAHVESIVNELIKWAKRAPTNDETQRRLQRIALCWGSEVSNDAQTKADPAKHHNHTVDTNNNNTAQIEQQQCQQQQQTVFTALNIDNSVHSKLKMGWVAEHALLRYEMLYEAGLLPESPDYQPNKLPKSWANTIGKPMYYDHRRVIATAISRLRAKIEYRPLIFGLMPNEFTLLQLQQSVEALSGVTLHKQNFRRLLESQKLLEPTGNSTSTGRGRPAKTYRFRFDIEVQSLLMDSKLPKR